MKYVNSISTAIHTIFWKSLSRLISFLKHIIIAATIGLSSQLDVFYLAISIIGVMVISWAGLFEIIAMPKMVQYIQKNRLSKFKHLTSAVFSLGILISILILLNFYFFPEYIAKIAPGLKDERIAFLTNSFFFLLPAIAFLIPFGFICSYLKS